MNNKLYPATLGGLIIGFTHILRAIPEVGTYLACCGCLATIVGGALAAAFHVKRSTERVTAGEGAKVGALAGLIAGAIQIFTVTPITYFTGDYRVNLGGGETEATKIIVLIIIGFVAAVFITIIATIGGAIGAAIFEKRKVEQYPHYNGSQYPDPRSYRT